MPDRDLRLLTAAAKGDAAEVQAALDEGASLRARDSSLRGPLLLAVLGSHVETVRVLVAAGADPNAQDNRHESPWLATGVTGDVAVMRALLPAKPDLTLRNRFGGISVIPASERGHVEYVRAVLAETDIDVNHVNNLGWTALLEAVILGDGSRRYQEIVEVLLAAGASPDLGDDDGVTPLRHAERLGFDAIAALLRAAE